MNPAVFFFEALQFSDNRGCTGLLRNIADKTPQK